MIFINFETHEIFFFLHELNIFQTKKEILIIIEVAL